jgi:hypothetical protein
MYTNMHRKSKLMCMEVLIRPLLDSGTRNLRSTYMSTDGSHGTMCPLCWDPINLLWSRRDEYVGGKLPVTTPFATLVRSPYFFLPSQHLLTTQSRSLSILMRSPRKSNMSAGNVEKGCSREAWLQEAGGQPCSKKAAADHTTWNL